MFLWLMIGEPICHGKLIFDNVKRSVAVEQDRGGGGLGGATASTLPPRFITTKTFTTVWHMFMAEILALASF